MLNSLLALCVGSILGALLRYGLGLAMNPLATAFPMGTLAANLVAAYVAGFAAAWLGTHPALSPAWRLLLITGFAGGLSTFSTFSLELLSLLRDGRLAWSLAMVAIHVCGSLLMAALGMASALALRTP